MKSYKSIEVGGLYETNNCGWIEVLSIQGAKDVHVRFVKTGYTNKGWQLDKDILYKVIKSTLRRHVVLYQPALTV